MRRQLELANEVAAALSGSGDQILRALEGHVECELFLRGNVITLDPGRPAASAVAITGGRITAVGDHHDVRQWRGNRTEVIDLPTK